MSRVCPDCGEPLDADERFCGACGCYLDWSESDSASAEPEPRPPEVATDPPPMGIAERVKSALGVGDRPPPLPPTGPLPTGRPVPEAPPVLDVRGTAERPSVPAADASAAGLVLPVDQAAAPTNRGAARQPSAQQPSRPRKQPEPSSALPPPAPLEPGDLVCGSCGAGNKPSRKFCRRCGDDLKAAVVAEVPWWRRIFRRKPAVVGAGTRPHVTGIRRRAPVGLIVLLVVLGALVLGGFLFRGLVVDGVEAVRDRLEGVEPRIPDRTTASSSLRGHGAALATSGDPAEYWAPASPGKGVGEYIEVTFDTPVRLVYVLVTPGSSPSDQKRYLATGRPSDLKITVDSEDGSTDVSEIHLEDKRGWQEFHIGESDVTKVRFEIVDSYVGRPGSHTAIGEIEFRTRK